MLEIPNPTKFVIEPISLQILHIICGNTHTTDDKLYSFQEEQIYEMARLYITHFSNYRMRKLGINWILSI